MNKHQIINKSIEYIVAHIDQRLTTEMVAQHAGYSPYHFFRMFSEVVGLPVKQYIIERRVKHVLYETQEGCRMIDAVMHYGFESYSGFYRACNRVYGVSPKVFLSRGHVAPPAVYSYGKESYPMLTELKVKQLLSNWSLSQTQLQAVYNENGQKRKDMWHINEMEIKVLANENKISQNVMISEAFKNRGIKTPQFIQTNSDQKYLSIDNQFVCLKEVIQTQIYSLDQIQSQTMIQLKLGAAVGKLQEVLSDIDDHTADETNVYDTCSNWAIDIVKNLNLDGRFDKAFFTTYEEFNELSKIIPKSIIHRNLHLNNIYFEKGEFAGCGDFYNTQKDVQLFDLCYLSTSILAAMPPEQYDDWPGILSNLMKGYNEHMEMSEESRRAVPYIIYSIQMIFIAYFACQDGLMDLAEKNYNILKWLYGHFQGN